MNGRRVYFIDWLRVLAVLLLFPFHAGRVFNVAEPFYAKSPVESLGIAFVLGFIDRWHMPLLFLLAGASTYYAMKKRSTGRFVGERATRLLVPLAFGTLVLVPPQTWLGARTNAAYTGSFVDYIASGRWLDASNLLVRGDYWGGISPAHLWFVMFLWIISMLVLPLLAWGKTDRGCGAMCRVARAVAKPRWWPVVVLVFLLGEALPEIGGKLLFFYLAYFVVGYAMVHDDAFVDAAMRWRVPTAVAGVLITTVTLLFYQYGESLPDPSVVRAVWTYVEDFGGWLSVVAIIGFGKVYLDRRSPALSYLAEASYPVYILHQTVIVVIAFALVQVIAAPFVAWPILIVASGAATFALYEAVRRTPPLRFVFGMRARPRLEVVR